MNHDPLAHVRALFDLDDSVVYLDGNSLGAPPKNVAARVQDVIANQWGRRLIRSWSEGWWTAPERIGDRIGKLVGAAPGQVVVADSTSVNLFKALMAAVRGTDRSEIVVDAGTFPTDGYIARSVADLTGLALRPVDPDHLAVHDRTAVVLLNHVDYRTGRLLDMAELTARAHAAGAKVVWDLCHSAGVLPIELDRLNVDLAVGCTYKFLNGGPGSPAFLYVPTAAQPGFHQPLTGWTGHRAPFAMTPDYTPDGGVSRARAGTPDIVSMLTLDAALDVWDQVDLRDVRAKGLALTAHFRGLVEDLPGIEVITPADEWRGHQVSLRHRDAESLMRRLIERDVIGDHRPPDVLRFGFAPLYNSFEDAERAAAVLKELL
ncbi:kynureninase [Actinosynnema sp. NPDC047251]|uniref:Kynureninase n=1 Tax=Saccharothrix espanaensis (strain ATCC 51144 / DSM 44229 / JCM 9112 / NBRC 15066 / NRRL 15764) TaxID=1179773 RepID=K0JQ44_SACES|nr:kynureninase [Saccharothrix espanaensis]CCH27641.1 Kynureninase [Saccharothrix espanaensis DSM 44229]